MLCGTKNHELFRIKLKGPKVLNSTWTNMYPNLMTTVNITQATQFLHSVAPKKEEVTISSAHPSGLPNPNLYTTKPLYNKFSSTSTWKFMNSSVKHIYSVAN